MAPAATAPAAKGSAGLMSQKKTKPVEIRGSNIQAAKALSDAIRTSLGPKGMDKMIQDAKGEVTITNDGATILDQMKVIHPAAKMLVELSKAQDVEAGDGTTSVVVMCGALLEASEQLLKKGIHPTSVSEAFQKAAAKSVEILTSIAKPVDLSDRDKLLQSANTSLNSKVVSQHSTELSPIAVDAVLSVVDPARADNVNLKDIKVIKKLGGTVDDTELIQGLVFQEKAAGNIKKVEKAKIGLIQFQVSPPKTDMDNQVRMKNNWMRNLDHALRLIFVSGHCLRLCRHGPSPEGGTRVHPEHCEADQEGGLQRSPGAEVHPQGRPLRPSHPLLRQDEDHGGQGHREGGH